MAIPDFRTLLAQQESSGKLLHIRKEVSQQYETAALMKKTQGRRPMLFEKIKGSPCPMACGMGGTRELLATSIGCNVEKLNARLAQAILHPVPVTQVKQAAVQENTVSAPFSIGQYMPVLTYNEKDCAPFLVSGMLAVHNLAGDRLYTSIRRMQYLGQNKATILITSHEMKEQFQICEAQHRKLDVADMFGVVPAVVLASQLSTHLYDCNKLDVAGALLGQPLAVVRCKTVDVDVLADSEMVLEGRVVGWKKATEGPFGEMGGYYGGVSQQPIVEFSALTYRDNPVMQGIFPSGFEEKLPMAICREVSLFSTIRQTVPGVRKVYITPPTLGRLHAVVQIHKILPSDGKQAALAAFASDKDLKQVIVVDEDIDICDAERVEWAVATRLQADRDVFIIPGCGGSPLEPSHCITGTTAKMGMDATCPLGDERFCTTHIPGEESIQLKDYL
ncbi:MAG: UbiD family decarboxylase [Oscillospiraceae bacterium]|nr:UbiD family decarboxylase [Oscillospiraceae bacterium]